MKTNNSFKWLVVVGFTFCGLEAFSLGQGANGSQGGKCAEGYKLVGKRTGRSVINVCELDTELMSSPSYNREGRRSTSEPSSPQSATKSKGPANRPAQNTGAKESSGGNGSPYGGPSSGDEANTVSGGNNNTQNDTSIGSGGPLEDHDIHLKGDANPITAPVGDEQIFCETSCPGGEKCEAVSDQSGIDHFSQNYEITRQLRVVKELNGTKSNAIELCLKPKTTAKNPNDDECFSAYQAASRACFAKGSDAKVDCNQENDTMQAIASGTKVIGAGSVASVELACSKIGEISKYANAGLSAWQTACAASRGTCETSCTEASKRYRECLTPEIKAMIPKDEIALVDRNAKMCVEYKNALAEAAQHAMAALAQSQAAKHCKDDVASDLTTNNVDECKKNPASPLCSDAQRCSNADFAAKNTICKCLNAPNSKECMANGGPVGGSGLATGGLGGGAGANDGGVAPGTAITGGTPGESPFSNMRDLGGKGDSPNLGGQKGNAGVGGASGGGSGGGPGSGSGGGSGGSDPGGDKKNINSGFYGSNSGTGAYFGNNSGAGSMANRSGINTGKVNYDKLKGAQFDPKRYIAGMNGKSSEYINGPHLNIFTIVKNRIEAKKPSLLDPDFRK